MSIAGSPEKIAQLGRDIEALIGKSVDATNRAELTNIEFMLKRLVAEVKLMQRRYDKTHQLLTRPARRPDFMEKVDKAIEKTLTKEMEGKVYEHVWVTNHEDTFFCAKDYYTVKNGKVLYINDGIEQISGDSLFSLKHESRCIGKYVVDKTYKGKRVTMKQTEVKKALKL